MPRKIIQQMKKLINYIYIILGIIIVSFILWNRLMRIRLPKDIPMNLSIWSYILYIGLTLIFLWLILISIYHMVSKTKESISMFSSITKLYYNSLYALDNTLTYIKTRTIDKYQIRFVQFCNKYIQNYTIIYLTFNMTPKIVVAVVFLIDTFYYNKISNFYKFLPLLLLPLLVRYLLYYYKNVFEKECQDLNKRISIYCYDIMDNMTIEISLSSYIDDIVIKKKLGKKPLDCLITVSLLFIQKLFEEKGYDMQKHTFNHKKALLVYHKIIDELIKIHTMQYLYTMPKTKYDSFVNLCMYTIYCFTWSYILYVSSHTLPMDTFDYILQLLLTIQEYIEPFSGNDI
jgi:hypothetical protein